MVFKHNSDLKVIDFSPTQIKKKSKRVNKKVIWLKPAKA